MTSLCAVSPKSGRMGRGAMGGGAGELDGGGAVYRARLAAET